MSKVLGYLGALIIRLLHITLRVRHVHAEWIESTPQYIISFWHEHLLLMLHSKFRRPITVMSSQSRDGQYIAQAFQFFNVEVVRGSSSKGASGALRALIRKARDGRNIVFTPDGPRGPRRVAKDGVVYAAQATGLPIVPMAFAAARVKRLASWDRMVVPYPFSRSVFVYGQPLEVPRKAEIEEWRLKVEQTMNALAEEAERLVNER